MKTTLLFLYIFTSVCLLGQEDRGYLIIENKGKSKCFFDKSNPHNFVNMMSQNYADYNIEEFYIEGYYYKKYAELDKYVFRGSPLTAEVDGYEEILYNDPEKNQTFDIWFDSIVGLDFDPTESDLLMYDKEWLHKKWLQTNINGRSGLLRYDPPQTYASFDGIDKLIITYEKRSDEIRYDDIYFIREVAGVSKPIIVGEMPFPESLRSKHGFELTDDETEELWSMNRKKAFENKLRNVAWFLWNGQEEYSKISPLGPPAFRPKSRTDYQASFNFGRKYVAEKKGEPIEVDIDGLHEVLMFKEGQTYNDWYDSIVYLSWDPTRSDLLIFEEGFLENRWNYARYAEDKIIRDPDYEIVYWWDYEGYSSHLLYRVDVNLNNYKFKPYINYGGGGEISGNDSTYNAFFAIKSGDIIIPLTDAKLENGTADSFEQFKKENTELAWAKLLYNQKAGKYISNDEKGRNIIDEMIETPVGFIKNNTRLDAVFSIDYE
ncbi:MAG: hypothetical protein P8H94_00475 [Crocinitomicaceae bacterium]|nr:hypothetical protein [Crocinitomicaceae bacterium]